MADLQRASNSKSSVCGVSKSLFGRSDDIVELRLAYRASLGDAECNRNPDWHANRAENVFNFDNKVKPVVDSVDEAIACYLTTSLNVLVINDFVICGKDQPLNETLRGSHAVLAAARKGMTWNHK